MRLRSEDEDNVKSMAIVIKPLVVLDGHSARKDKCYAHHDTSFIDLDDSTREYCAEQSQRPFVELHQVPCQALLGKCISWCYFNVFWGR